MTERSRTCAATAVGAVIGGLAGYMFLTDRGRRLRREIEPALDSLVRELSHFRSAVTKAGGVASEGWKLLNETIGDAGTNAPAPRYSNPHQTSPF